MILCSGKHFYALDAYRREKGLKNTALIRLEVTGMKTASAEYVTFFCYPLSPSQLLCPFPSGYLHQELKKYSAATGTSFVFFSSDYVTVLLLVTS